MSDISYNIRYNPVRDQIIRNIDNGIEMVDEFKDFYFFLLTPKVFRTDQYGGSKQTGLTNFIPDKSRLYCYKMNEYKDPKNLRRTLPHRKHLSSSNWNTISNNLGWITFEDIYRSFLQYNTIVDTNEKNLIKDFF